MSNGRPSRRKLAKDLVVEGTSWFMLLAAPLVAGGGQFPQSDQVRVQAAENNATRPLTDDRPEQEHQTIPLRTTSYVVTGGSGAVEDDIVIERANGTNEYYQVKSHL